MKVPLGDIAIGDAEITAALRVLLSGRLSMGQEVASFERGFADFVGSKHAVMVNSGSSANLLLMEIVKRFKPHKTKNVLTPAISWSTTVAPIIQLGMRPVFVDVDPLTLKMDTDAAIRYDARGDSKNIYYPVHILGQPCAADELAAAAAVDCTIMVEDACEAFGAFVRRIPHGEKIAGTLGLAGSYSFYVSHHLQTIEGGMVVTDDDLTWKLLLQLREHGWIRRLDEYEQLAAEKANPGIDRRFLFTEAGYNLRPTEINGAIGSVQLGRAPNFLVKRYIMYEAFRQAIHGGGIHIPEMDVGASHFALPMMVTDDAKFTRDQLRDYLEQNEIETRGLIGGNITKQPFLRHVEYDTIGDLPGAKKIHDQYLMVGLYPSMTAAQAKHVIRTVKEFKQKCE